MWAGFQTAVELLYPPRCLGCGTMVESDFGLCGPCWRQTPFIHGTVCDACGVALQGSADGERLLCDDCMKMPRPWRQGRSAMLYKDRGRELVLGLKHSDRTEIARPAGMWLETAARPFLDRNLLVVPVPLHWSRLLQRRYNQSALLGRELARRAHLAFCPDFLLRTRKTRTQDHKSVVQRGDEVRGAFRVNSKRQHLLDGRDVLIVDDVMTSGATLAACTEACQQAGIDDVYVLALARVAKDD